jgi:hypothetical protein
VNLVLAQLPSRQKAVIRVPDVIIETTVTLVIWLMGVTPSTNITIKGVPWYWSFRLERSKKLKRARMYRGNDLSYPGLTPRKTLIGHFCGSYHLQGVGPDRGPKYPSLLSKF